MILCGLAASCATTTVMAQATGNRSSYFLEGSVYRCLLYTSDAADEL